MRACASCGEENPDRAKFCNNCAAPLADETTPARETRKTVTIVFTDVTGSTALGERLDPETLRRVMSRYFDTMRRVIEAHGGTVEKFIGDAVMAVFGVPTLHEDDALRAVRAVIDMREGLARLNEDLERDHGVSIATRTGVTTGEVVAGDPTREETFVSGDAVNTAARLEQNAQPGKILIGEPTYRLVRDAVKAERAEPVDAKGKAEPVAAWRLLEVTPGAAGFARRLDSPMVGRDRELRLLGEAFDRTTSERSCHLFTLLGPTGVGKSRLTGEFVAAKAADSTLLRGRCLPYGEGITFWPLVEMIRQAAGISEEDSPDEGRSKLAGLVSGAGDEGDVILDRVAQIVGFAQDSAVPEETFWAVRKLFESLAERGTITAVFDDIHWAEPNLLDLIENIADWSRDAPILLLCVARPELLEHRPTWGGGKMNASSILLEPLAEADADALIDNLLGGSGLDADARAHITAAAEGNPLFVEEMVEMLIDDGLLSRRDGGWVQTGDVSKVRAPPTIQALIAARLDRLDPAERAVMERASVEGKQFHVGAVVELSGDESSQAVRSSLMALARKDLIRPAAAEFAGEDAFRFRHMLIRDAAYDALPKEQRAEMHERFARWLERKVGPRAREYEEIVGYHLEQAFRYRRELGPLDERDWDLGRAAADHLAAAGRRAHARGDAGAAVSLLSRSADILPEKEPVRIRILAELGTPLIEVSDYKRARRLGEEAEALAAESGDLSSEIMATVTRLEATLSLEPEGAVDLIKESLGRMVPMLEGVPDEEAVARVWELACDVAWMGCNFGEAAGHLERALEHARRAGSRPAVDRVVGRLAAAFLLGPIPAGEAVERCELLLEEVGTDSAAAAWVHLSAAPLRAYRGIVEGVREEIRAAQERMTELGMASFGVGVAAERIFFVEKAVGDVRDSEETLRLAIDLFEAAGEKGFASTDAARMAEVMYVKGDDAEALRWAGVAEEYGGSDDIATQWMARGVRAKVAARRGRPEEAERLALSAIEIVGTSDCLEMQAEAHLDLATVLEAASRVEEAADALEEAARLFERKGDVVSAPRARSKAEALRARG